MSKKEYKLPNGKTAVFEYDIFGIGQVTLECMDELMGMIADRPQGWTPCSERLPERDGNYLIQVNFKWGAEFEIGEWSSGMWWNDNRHANVAWMPLPEPYDSADMRGKDDE